MADKPKRKRRVKVKRPPVTCECCGERTGSYVEHHLSYEPEVKANMCIGCHLWCHGTAKIYRHRIKTESALSDGANARGLAPFLFASAVVDLYTRKMPHIITINGGRL